MPIAGDKQREALGILVDHVFSDKAFKFSPTLLRRQASEKWMHWGSRPDGVDISIYDRILGIQRIGLAHCLDAEVLTRVQDQELQSDPGSKPLALAEIFRTLSNGIFSELTIDPKAKPNTLAISTIRRNIQREYISRLSGIVLGPKAPALGGNFMFVVFSGSDEAPADARALARLHLKELAAKLGPATAQASDDTTKAHLEECQQRIFRVLGANVSANQP